MVRISADNSAVEMASAAWAFHRYEEIRDRLPQACFAQTSVPITSLADIEDRFDAFVFDSFGVLNVGETPVPAAGPRVAALRAAGKHVLVLTNAATGPLADLARKYSKLGFDFSAAEIVSSRDVLATALQRFDSDMVWGIVAPVASRIEELAVKSQRLCPESAIGREVAGIILLSSQGLDRRLVGRLADLLRKRPLPVLVGNPDLVAPRETGFSLEPGSYAHDLADRLGIVPEFFGKPYANAFEAAKARLPRGMDPARIAMVGDTLHTDILGGAAAGFKTLLVTADGVMKELDVAACIATSGIVPDYIAPHI